MKKGFTLTELLIALGVIGVLAAVLMPVVHNIIPNQNVMMAKRAYYTVQTAVSDLINDSACYPDKTQASGSERRVGFDDGYGYENCIWGNNTIPDTSQYIESEGSADQKFQALFAEKIGDLEDFDKTRSDSILSNTKDGVYYTLGGNQEFNTIKNNTSAGIMIGVDVNGKGKGDDCASSYSWGLIPQCESGKKPDSFIIKLYADGKIVIFALDTWAIEAVKANANITGK